LAGRGPGQDAEAIQIVPGHVGGDHLDGTAGQAEGQGPQGRLAGQGDDGIRRQLKDAGQDLPVGGLPLAGRHLHRAQLFDALA
jgi:hypothetical protein